MSEETDALSNRIRQLENQVADMQRLAQDTSDLLDIARANGLDKFLMGHGLVEYGGGVMRLDNTGAQIKADASNYALQLVNDFFPKGSPPTTLAYLTSQNGVLSTKADITGFAVKTTGSAFFRAEATAADSFDVTLQAQNLSFPSSGVAGIFLYCAASQRYTQVTGPLLLQGAAADDSSLTNGELWYQTTVARFRAQQATYTGNVTVELESPNATAITNSSTITTANTTSARVAPAGAVTGIILQAGTTGGQTCTVVNESVAASTVTFAASGTSHVSDGTSSVIAGLTARRFVWDSGTSLWYPCK